MEELIRPNWHIAVVHFPIALLVAGTLIEVFSFLGWRRSSFRSAGRWMLLLGAILAVPTAFSGLYALSDVAPGGLSALRDADSAAGDRLWTHLLITSSATVLSMLVTVAWIACSDVWRTRLSLVFKLLLLVAMVGVMAGAHEGGELVYDSGIGIEKLPPASLPTGLGAFAEEKNWAALVGDREQPHVIMAGLVMAIACVALGWSIRAITQDDDPAVAEETQAANRIAAAFAAESSELKSLLAGEAQLVSSNHTPPVRAGRIWLLAFFLGIVTAAGGLWIIAGNDWNPDKLWQEISQPIAKATDPALTRRLAHLICGGVIIACTLMLALLARFGRKNRLGLILFAPPLVIALALQVWLGILLLLDTAQGKLTAFNP